MMVAPTSLQLTPEQIVRDVRRLPSLPMVVLELLRSIDLDASSMKFLANKISHDQALAATALRLANSSFYGMPAQVGDMQQAISLLGLSTVRSLVVAASITTSFAPASGAGLDLAAFWRESIGTAVCAKYLAPLSHAAPNTAFIAGLLHDIGRLVIATCYAPAQIAVTAWQAEHGGAISDAERAITGTDHAAIGAALTAHWHFPQEIVDAVADHHGGQSALSRVVWLADLLSHALALEGTDRRPGNTKPDPDSALDLDLDPGLCEQIGLDNRGLARLVGKILAEHAGICQVLVQ